MITIRLAGDPGDQVDDGGVAGADATGSGVEGGDRMEATGGDDAGAVGSERAADPERS